MISTIRGHTLIWDYFATVLGKKHLEDKKKETLGFGLRLLESNVLLEPRCQVSQVSENYPPVSTMYVLVDNDVKNSKSARM